MYIKHWFHGIVIAALSITAAHGQSVDTSRIETGTVQSVNDTGSLRLTGKGAVVTAGTFISPLSVEPSDHTTVIIQRSKTVDYHRDNIHLTLSNNDIIRIPPSISGGHITSAANDSIEAIVIRFRNGDNTLSKITTETRVPLDRLQFFSPRPGIDVRMIEIPGGQTAFLRMDRNAVLPEERMTTEACHIVTRGTAEATINGKRTTLQTGDMFTLDSGDTVSYSTGPRGLDVIAAFTPGRDDYTRALQSRMDAIHGIVASGTEPVLIVDGETESPGLTFTEGPSWMNGRLYFSNYYKFWKPFGSSEEGGIQVVDENGEHRVLNMNVQTCGTTPLPNGKLAVCDLFGRSVVEMDPETGAFGRTIAASYNGIPFAVANDVITDQKGGLYITDSSVAKKGPKQPGTALYYVTPDGETLRVTDPGAVDYINGVVLSPDDKTLYLNGSGEEYILAFDVADDGTLSNRRPFARLFSLENELDKERPRSVPDGMTIDRSGRLFVATPYGVQVFDPSGGHIGIIHFPRQPSHCVFGGNDHSTLFVTARKHVYAIRTLTAGFQYPIR